MYVYVQGSSDEENSDFLDNEDGEEPDEDGSYIHTYIHTVHIYIH